MITAKCVVLWYLVVSGATLLGLWASFAFRRPTLCVGAGRDGAWCRANSTWCTDTEAPGPTGNFGKTLPVCGQRPTDVFLVPDATPKPPDTAMYVVMLVVVVCLGAGLGCWRCVVPPTVEDKNDFSGATSWDPTPIEPSAVDHCTICNEDSCANASDPWCRVHPCGHRFHRRCVQTWVRTVAGANSPPTCPNCRSYLTLTGGAALVSLAQIVIGTEPTVEETES